MAQTLAATRYAAQTMLTNVFTAMYYTDALEKQPNALIGLIDKQLSNVRPIMDTLNPNMCNGFEAAFQKVDSETLPTITSTASAKACVIPAGRAMTTDKIAFTKDLYVDDTMTYNDNLCSDLFTLPMLVANLMLVSSHLRVMALNAEIIDRVNTNAQTATYPSAIGTISAGTVYIPDLDTWKPENFGTKLLPYLEDIAIHEGLADDFIILGGSVLGLTKTTTDYIRMNDNQRAEGAILDDWADRMVIDRRGMADASLSENIYLIDRRAYGLALTNVFSPSVTETRDANNTVRYSTPLMYATKGANGSNEYMVNQLTYKSGGQTVQARVDFEEQVACATGGYDNRTTLTTNVRSILEGIIAFAPNDGLSRTGIVKIQRGTP